VLKFKELYTAVNVLIIVIKPADFIKH